MRSLTVLFLKISEGVPAYSLLTLAKPRFRGTFCRWGFPSPSNSQLSILATSKQTIRRCSVRRLKSGQTEAPTGLASTGCNQTLFWAAWELSSCFSSPTSFCSFESSIEQGKYLDIHVAMLQTAFTWFKLGVSFINSCYAPASFHRMCTFCHQIIGDEVHFVFICPIYFSFRCRYFCYISSFTVNSSYDECSVCVETLLS